MKFWLMYYAAWARGLSRRWPSMPPVPQGYTGVSCGFRTRAEVRAMWNHGWEPWSFQRTPGYGAARLFRVKLTADEVEYNRVSAAEDRRLADEYERGGRPR